MRKFLLLLIALLTGISGAWAETYTITFDHRTGTFYRGGSVSTGWVNQWVSNEAGKPAVTITASANNINAANGRMAPGSLTTCTYTLSTEDGYVVTGFSMNCPTFGADVTVTPAGEGAIVVATGGTLVVNSSASSFVYSGSNDGRIQASAGDGGSFTITVVKPTDEQSAAYNKVQGWISTIQGAEGLVTDASNYISNAKSTAEGTYEALLDQNYATYFHGAYGSEGPDEDQYLQATLSKSVDAICFYYKKRSQNNNNRPTSITISGSNDGSNFTDITTINSGLPTSADVLDYTSNKINLGASYQYLRFTVTATNNGATNQKGHVFFTFSEFYILPSNSHVDEAIAIYRSGKKAYEYTADDITQINALDLQIRSATLAPLKANILATYAIPDGKVGTMGYPTQAAWDTFEATINGITIEDDFDAVKNSAIAALLASSMPADGVYKIKNFSTEHYLYQDEADGIVTYATTETPTGNHGYWRVTDNGDGTFAILDLYGHQLTKGNQSQNWSGVQAGNRTQVTTITRDYTDANYKTSGDLVSFYLEGAHINTSYNTGSKVFVTTWTTGGLGSNANHWFFEPVDVSGLTAYTITITDAPQEITMADGTVLTNGTFTVYLSAVPTFEDFENYEKEVVNDGSAYTVTYTITDYSAMITEYLTEYRMNNIGGAGRIGYMQITSEAFSNLMNLLLTFQDPSHVYTAEDYNNLRTYYEASAANVTLPETGKFYRFKSNATGKYIGFAESGSQPMVEEASAAIYYYTADKNLLNYSKGRYLSVSTGNGATAIGVVGGSFNFYKSGYSTPTLGTCRIRDINNAKGSLIDWTDGYLNGWGEGNHERCEWIVEEITTLPVTITDAGYATLCAPVALSIPENVTVSTLTINVDGERLDETSVEGTIPAGTPVLLTGEAGNYSFATTTNVETTYENVLVGTYPAIPAPNGSYILQKQGEKVGFYLVDTEEAQPNVPGFRAYLQVPGESSDVKAFFFGDIATGVSGLKVAAENAATYNLAGQRVAKATKGIYIVNGKKVVVK